jgi:hypothetical protein
VELGLLEASGPSGSHRVRMNHGRDGTVLVDSMRGIGWVAEGETGTTEEVANGVIGATQGTEVDARVIVIVCGAKGKSGLSWPRVERRKWTELPGGRLDHQRGRSDHLEARSDHQPLQHEWSDHLVARSDHLVEPWSSRWCG